MENKKDKDYIQADGITTKAAPKPVDNNDLENFESFGEDYNPNSSEDIESILNDVLEKHENSLIPPPESIVKDIKSNNQNNNEIDFPTGSSKKEYIDTSLYKSEDESDESWIEENGDKNNDNDDAAKEKNAKGNIFILLNKFSPRTIFFVIMGAVIVIVLAVTAPKDKIVNNSSDDLKTENNSVIVQKSVTQEELSELTSLIEVYTKYQNQSDNLRSQEINVLNGYVDGTYTEKQAETLFMRSMTEKQTALANCESISVSPALSDLKTLFERYLRADLNHSKKVISNIMNGLKAAQVLNEYSGTSSANLENLTNYSNELERVLKLYNVKYERTQNKFKF